MKILLNRIQCKKCNYVITSYHVHDFKYCKCKAVGIDGGTQYLKRMGVSDDYEEFSVMDNGYHETRRNNVHWGVNYTKEGKRLPKTNWVLIKYLNTDHIKAIFLWYENKKHSWIFSTYKPLDSFIEECLKDELEWREKHKL